MSDPDTAELAGFIDHTLLKPEATESDIETLCAEALTHRFATVCVNSSWLPLVSRSLAGSGVGSCGVVGFPLGAALPGAIADETWRAIDAGATEIDMVMAVGMARSGHWGAVETGIRKVLTACDGVPLKVILETCLLTEEEKRRACRLCRDLGVAFVKTSTGFSSGGASAADIGLMRAEVGPDLGVKASGGIRDADTARQMLAAGATRLGCSASVAIVTGSSTADGY